MPDQAYMLPDEWKRYEMQREIDDERAQITKEDFIADRPEYAGNCWHHLEVENFFEFIDFQFIAKVRRKSDGQVGWLSFTAGFPRIYFGFRELR